MHEKQGGPRLEVKAVALRGDLDFCGREDTAAGSGVGSSPAHPPSLVALTEALLPGYGANHAPRSAALWSSRLNPGGLMGAGASPARRGGETTHQIS
ncbi:hypothetical protein NDU88_003878 [Pleurodeles waltl]|uniref:Uncharacterized protein n=1 Tax=Pleurodeles waltl TaxID=8319 RepID=A0AAV7UDB9_PLEWA|nr:hypothetical protein NDU88_003878 [Pleurodeles waltl]